MCSCSRNVESWPEAVIEHLVEGRAKQGSSGAGDVCDGGVEPGSPLPSPHLKVGSGAGNLLEIPASPRPSEGKQLLSFVSVLMVIAFENILTYCTLGPCYCVITAVLSIVLQ